MAKTSKTVPKKEKASSSSASRPAKPVVPPTLEEITPGDCIIKKDFATAWAPLAVPDLEDWVRKLAATSSYDKRKWRELAKGQWEAKNHGECLFIVSTFSYILEAFFLAHACHARLGDVSEKRPDPPGEETKPSNPKSEKDKKRKRVSKPEDPQVAEPSELDTSSRAEDAPKGEIGKAPTSPEVEIDPLPSTTIPEGVYAETPNDNENAPSEELEATTTGHSLSLPTYFEGAIEEANAMPKPDPNKIIEGDPFQGCYARIEDANDFNDASSLFEEAQRLLIRAIAKFRTELSQCEAELKKVSGEEKALRFLCGQREEELKDLRTTLAKAQKSESELDEQVTAILTKFGLLGPTLEAKTSISQLQQKLDMIGQLRGEVDRVRADCQQWKKNIDQLAAEKEDVKAQLASAEAQLRGAEAKSLDQAREVEGLEAEIAKARIEAAQAKAEAAQAKAEAEKTKVAADKSIAIYIREATTVQAELREASDRARRRNGLAKCRARRETLEEIRAQGFDLADEIAEAQARESDARFLVSSDDEDVGSVPGFYNNEEEKISSSSQQVIAAQKLVSKPRIDIKRDPAIDTTNTVDSLLSYLPSTRLHMIGIGRGKGRGGTGRRRGYFQGRGNSGATSQPQLQLRGNTRASLETGESNNPFQEPIETGQISSPLQRPSVETVSSRNLDGSVYPSPEAESGSARIDGENIFIREEEASVSSAMATVRQEMQAEMQAEMSRKLQEEHDKWLLN
ncbi:PREDICTED: uncharacterized protein LOC109209867 [Nicotiana attenuata]|uniref:uncharacterized protein LOC109209867 n=1 Tax=Nicotiana attenuata TaxID=49451 RepID=UPI000905D4C4|nr:PREDICTED: uncharacterized protein LOC109209867 [Nicotiana attenuata]